MFSSSVNDSMLLTTRQAFIYELGRRLHCEESLKSVMHKQGAVEGTTKGSIQEAFSKFIFTPLITGEHFKNKEHHHE